MIVYDNLECELIITTPNHAQYVQFKHVHKLHKPKQWGSSQQTYQEATLISNGIYSSLTLRKLCKLLQQSIRNKQIIKSLHTLDGRINRKEEENPSGFMLWCEFESKNGLGAV